MQDDKSVLEEQFLQEVAIIQESTVQNALTEQHQDLKFLLNAVTYDVLVGVMEIFDGYRVDLDLRLVDKTTNRPLFEGVELHDKIADYLKQ